MNKNKNYECLTEKVAKMLFKRRTQVTPSTAPTENMMRFVDSQLTLKRDKYLKPLEKSKKK